MKHPNHIQGFGLVETLVAFLIISLFTLIGLQAFVSAVAIKARAQQESVVTKWIQESIETDKQAALDTSIIPYTESSLSFDALSTATSITIDDASNFRPGDDIIIGTDSVSNVISSVSGNIINLSAPINTNQNQNTPVIARCRAETDAGGFSAYLNANLPEIISDTNNTATPNVGTKTISGRQYRLRRSLAVRNEAPYAVSQLTYTVTLTTAPAPIANISTEIVPNAFFECP